MALQPQSSSVSRRPTTHRECSSKLPWNTEDPQYDDLQFDDSSDEDHLVLKVVLSLPLGI